MSLSTTRRSSGVYVINNHSGSLTSFYYADNMRYDIGADESVTIIIEDNLLVEDVAHLHVHKISNNGNNIINAGYNPN